MSAKEYYNINCGETSSNLWFKAAICGYYLSLRRQVALGVDVNKTVGNSQDHGKTALHLVLQLKSQRSVELLLNSGVHPIIALPNIN